MSYSSSNSYVALTNLAPRNPHVPCDQLLLGLSILFLKNYSLIILFLALTSLAFRNPHAACDLLLLGLSILS